MLDHRGIERWDVDSMEPGAHVGEQLRTAINACDLCVFLATTTSLRAEWCYAELGAFWGQGKKVLIYLIDESLRDKLPPQFQGYLWINDAERLIDAIGPPIPKVSKKKKELLNAFVDGKKAMRTPKSLSEQLGWERDRSAS